MYPIWCSISNRGFGCAGTSDVLRSTHGRAWISDWITEIFSTRKTLMDIPLVEIYSYMSEVTLFDLALPLYIEAIECSSNTGLMLWEAVFQPHNDLIYRHDRGLVTCVLVRWLLSVCTNVWISLQGTWHLHAIILDNQKISSQMKHSEQCKFWVWCSFLSMVEPVWVRCNLCESQLGWTIFKRPGLSYSTMGRLAAPYTKFGLLRMVHLRWDFIIL